MRRNSAWIMLSIRARFGANGVSTVWLAACVEGAHTVRVFGGWRLIWVASGGGSCLYLRDREIDLLCGSAIYAFVIGGMRAGGRQARRFMGKSGVFEGDFALRRA